MILAKDAVLKYSCLFFFVISVLVQAGVNGAQAGVGGSTCTIKKNGKYSLILVYFSQVSFIYYGTLTKQISNISVRAVTRFYTCTGRFKI